MITGIIEPRLVSNSFRDMREQLKRESIQKQRVDRHNELMARLLFVKGLRDAGFSWNEVFDMVNQKWQGWCKTLISLQNVYSQYKKYFNH